MSEKLDQVAKAISEADDSWDGEDYRVLARAAIEAMREPTDRMVSEGESAASFGIGKPTSEDAIPRVWSEMIDAALKD
jgi:hypothetical protein